MGQLNIKVVTIALPLPDDEGIQERVEQLWDLGVVVVAPTGNRPGNDGGLPRCSTRSYESHRPGEDVADADPPGRLRARARGERHDDGHDAARSSPPTWSWRTPRPTSPPRPPWRCPTPCRAAPASSTSRPPRGPPPRSAACSRCCSRRTTTTRSRRSAGSAHTAAGRPDLPNTLVGAGEVQAYRGPDPADRDGRRRHGARAQGAGHRRAPGARGAGGARRRAGRDPRERRLVGAARRRRSCCWRWCCDRCWRGAAATVAEVRAKRAPKPRRSDDGPARRALGLHRRRLRRQPRSRRLGLGARHLGLRLRARGALDQPAHGDPGRATRPSARSRGRCWSSATRRTSSTASATGGTPAGRPAAGPTPRRSRSPTATSGSR